MRRSLGIDVAERAAAPGVAAVLIGADVKRLTSSMVVGVKAPLECWPIAIDRVRYVGEPVAIVVARDRYLAEDALDLIEVDYEPLPAVVDPLGRWRRTRRSCTTRSAGNLASDRSFRYGDPERAFAQAPHRVVVDGALSPQFLHADRDLRRRRRIRSGEDAYDVLANFQGPFSIHAVISRALKVPGNRLRLRTPPDSGGSFGVKQGVFPYIVLIAAAARVAGAPVKWIEDRLEHLAGVGVGDQPSRRHLRAAVETDGRITALDWDQVEDCGAHSARAGACHALSHARQHDGRIRHPQCRDPQPRRPHQQDAERTQPRLRRPAGLFRAGAAGAADRDRTRSSIRST